MNDVEKLANWMDRQISDGADSFKLEQLGNIEEEAVIDSWPVRSFVGSGGLGGYATDILSSARDYVENTGQSTRFILRSYQGDVRSASVPLPAINPSATSAITSFDGGRQMARSPNHPVIDSMIQSNTHTERMHRITVQAVGESMSAILDENRSLRMRIKRMERQRDENMQAREELISEAHLRKLASDREANYEKRKDEVVSKLMALIPIVAAKLSGKPDKIGAQKMVIEAFKGSLTDEQIATITSTFNIPQRMLLEELLGLGTPTKDAEEARVKAEAEAKAKADVEAEAIRQAQKDAEAHVKSNGAVKGKVQ